MEDFESLSDQDLNLHYDLAHLNSFRPNPNAKEYEYFVNFESNPLLQFYLNAACVANKLVDVVKQELNEELKRNNIRYQHWQILKVIYFDEANTPAAIAERISVNRSSITRLLDHLELRSLIKRERDRKDRRVLNLILTKEGKELFKSGLKTFLRIPKIFRDSLTMKELGAIDHIEGHFTSRD